MTYRVPQSLEDIIRLKEDGEPENPYLEYKSGKLFDSKNDKIFETLSKEITAFGNSAGGVLIIGVDEDADRCISRLSPVAHTTKNDSWIEDGVLPRVNPPISYDIQTLDTKDGRIFVINVPPSPAAPHQASDKKYYARRLFRVDPLLSFEIDDIRRRSEASPLRVSSGLWPQNGLINFSIKNEGIAPVHNVSFSVEGVDSKDIANTWTPTLNRPYKEPFKVIHPDSEMSFLGASYDFFRGALTDSFVTVVKFDDENGIRHEERRQYYLKDLAATQRPRTRTEEALKEINGELGKIAKALDDLSRIARSVEEKAFHASGLNLSDTTLRALSGERNWKWAGENLSMMALAEVLEIDTDSAHRIWQEMYGGFHLAGGKNVPVDDLDVSEETKAKIRARLRMAKG